MNDLYSLIPSFSWAVNVKPLPQIGEPATIPKTFGKFYFPTSTFYLVFLYSHANKFFVGITLYEGPTAIAFVRHCGNYLILQTSLINGIILTFLVYCCRMSFCTKRSTNFSQVIERESLTLCYSSMYGKRRRCSCMV